MDFGSVLGSTYPVFDLRRGSMSGSVAKLAFGGKIRKSALGKSTTCESQLSCFRCFATEPCRTLAMAQRVVHRVTGVLAPGCVPLFLTDGLKDYATALLTYFGQWRQPARHQEKGPMPKPRWMPLPVLLYAQVVKSYRRRVLVGVKHRVVFGTQRAIAQVLATCGWAINTSFVEWLNLDI